MVTLGTDASPTLPCGKPSRKCQRSGNFWRGEAALWGIMYISWHMVGAQSTERNSFIRAPENSRYHMTGFLGKAERKAIHPITTERIGFGLTRSTMLVRAGSTQSCKGLKGHSYLFSQGPDLFSLLRLCSCFFIVPPL